MDHHISGRLTTSLRVSSKISSCSGTQARHTDLSLGPSSLHPFSEHIRDFRQYMVLEVLPNLNDSLTL